MIIPVRCFSCNKVIGNKYKYFCAEVLKRKKENNDNVKGDNIIDMNSDDIKKTIEGQVMDELGLERTCCRKSIYTHVELIYDIN